MSESVPERISNERLQAIAEGMSGDGFILTPATWKVYNERRLLAIELQAARKELGEQNA
jgi:hypothetical protein